MENRNVTDSVELKSSTCTACEEGTVNAENAAAVKEAEEKPVFDKELFKRSILYNVMNMFRKNLEEATPQQIFQAASYSIKDRVIGNWMTTQEAYDKEDPKMVYYMSMEFLMGRALGNNMINLQAYQGAKEVLEELGVDINVLEDQEPDAALGNGGLGRLAACFLDSLLPAAASAIVTACSSRRSRTASRGKFPMTGWRTAILLSCADPSTQRW